LIKVASGFCFFTTYLPLSIRWVGEMPLNPSTLEFWPESDDSEYEDSDDYSEYLEEQNLSADGLQDATSSEARQRSTLDHNLHHTSAWKTTPELGYKQVCVEIISTKKVNLEESLSANL